jgi:hypothetical protein
LPVQPSKRLVKWTIGLGSLALLAVAYTVVWGPQTFFFFWSRSVGHRAPESYVTPEPLPFSRPDPSPGTKLSYYGYSCEVPWIDIAQERKASAFTAIVFRSGQMIWFPDPSSKTTLQILSEGNPDTERNISLSLGGVVPVSDEVLKTRILYATPADLSPFMKRKEAVTESMLLLAKALSLQNAVGHIYWFRDSERHGFQVGDPDKAHYVELVLFRKDGREVPFTVFAGKGPAGLISQQQIERIRTTLRIEDNPSKLPGNF